MERTDTSENASALAPHASPLGNGLVIYRYGDRTAILTREAIYEVRPSCPTCQLTLTDCSEQFPSLAITSI